MTSDSLLTLDEASDYLAADLLDGIQCGAGGQWRMPWTGVAARPLNAFSGRPFAGRNLVSLWSAARRRRHRCHLWASELAWRARGGTLLDDAIGAMILVPVFDDEAPGSAWTVDQRDRIAAKLGPIGGDALGGQSKPLLGFQRERWFNAEEVTGVPVGEPSAPAPDDAAARLESVLDAWRSNTTISPQGPALLIGGLEAKWHPGTDRITMPPRHAFQARQDISAYALYVQTLAHESIHATGSKRRCARNMTGSKGSKSYAIEELIAESGAALLSTAFGLAPALLDHSKAYMSSWAQLLNAKELRGKFMWAFSEGARACDYIVSAGGWRGRAQNEA